jgi:hypothetical protein
MEAASFGGVFDPEVALLDWMVDGGLTDALPLITWAYEKGGAGELSSADGLFDATDMLSPSGSKPWFLKQRQLAMSTPGSGREAFLSTGNQSHPRSSDPMSSRTGATVVAMQRKGETDKDC